MTLCVVWKDSEQIHFASDSRLTIASNSYADVGIKVLSLPYRIFSPRDPEGNRSLDVEGELGMCFAGSAVNSLVVKESIAEVLKELQHVPGYTNISMTGIAKLIFTAYRLISTEICLTTIGANGRAAIVIAGWCTDQNCVRAFLLETSNDNQHSCREILTSPNQHHFIGNGKTEAEAKLTSSPSNNDYLRALKAVIDGTTENSVGGSIQYGRFENDSFKILGIVEFNNAVHYWRGALDLNSADFMGGHDDFIPGLNFIDPFNTFSAEQI